MGTLLSLVWLWSAVAHAAVPEGCEAARSATDLQTETVQAAIAFAALDTDGFARSAASAREVLRCLNEPLSAGAVVELHRTEAIEAFTQQDVERTRAGFQAILATKADWSFPEALGGPGHPLRKLFDEAAARPPSLMSPFESHGLTVRVNGAVSGERPANIPAVVQASRPDGEVLWSGYIRAGMPMPDLAGIASAAGVVAAAPAPVEPVPPPTPPPVDGMRDGRKTGMRYGFDLGFGTWIGARVVYRRPEQHAIDGYGVRLVAATAIGGPYGVSGGGGLVPYIDLRLSKSWNLEPSLWFAAHDGAVVAGGGATAQWEYKKFHVNLGFFASGAAGGLFVPDLGVGFLF